MVRALPLQDRDALLAAARRHFARNGFERASLNAVLEEVGMSKGAFYYHFESKDDLFSAVVRDTIVPVLEAAGRPAPADSPETFWGNLERYMDRANEAFLSDPDALGLLRAAASRMSDPGWLRAYEEMRQGSVRVVLDVIADGQRVGAVRDDLPAELLAGVVMAVMEQLDQWALRNWEDVSPQRADEWSRLGRDLMRRVAAPGVAA